MVGYEYPFYQVQISSLLVQLYLHTASSSKGSVLFFRTQSSMVQVILLYVKSSPFISNCSQNLHFNISKMRAVLSSHPPYTSPYPLDCSIYFSHAESESSGPLSLVKACLALLKCAQNLTLQYFSNERTLFVLLFP